ncbi:serine/threonine-protein kinase [Entomoplasma freundtii]|uniref:Serine/threonine protein kinase n=1 Tax=Entomoplasma freundtii TaxID=74700 RepID=A0A2K8NQY8_9MOLU|nr:serine/threonine-protein kinase [Entomoplasma freundtii]ATZ16265.1 serine/threonine protein kinase [Entomoplasma freundtii]TDY56834.1 serine/threonine-protein kinase [Entomoplasma freundtii]
MTATLNKGLPGENVIDKPIDKETKKEKPFFNNGFLFAERYKILKKIGQGAHAEVYQAIDTLDNQKLVALKIIKVQQEDFARQEKHLDMEREAFARLIFNKNVIGLRDFDRSRKLFYMVIDLATGATNFQNKFRHFGNILTNQEIIYYFDAIAKGMQGIHDVGIIHRDLKPQNILINDEEVVKISDFGISKLKTNIDKSHVSGFEGTPKYAAPEQYLTNNEFYFQSDIYSVGIMLYELATGVTPYAIFKDFKTDKERYTFILNQHLKEPITHPKVFNPNLPVALDNLIMKCLAKDLKYRYQTFAEFQSDLHQVLASPQPKMEEINQEISHLKIRKTLKRTKKYQFERFFKIFNFRHTLIFFILIGLLVLTLLLSILLS